MYNIFPYLGFLLRANKALLKNREEFNDYVQATFVENLKTLDKNDQRNFIDAFLVKQQEEKSTTNGYFHNDNLQSLVSNLFTAGVETISTTLNWSFLLMLKYPEVQRRRICAGETLAKMELFLFFTSLLQRFTFCRPPGVSISDLDLSPAISFNIIPKPYKMCAVSRS
ncbi:cytochrome p450 2k1-like [Limosa lapponica baueri]|uniref:Cytochrome p450 2k1-like n=1 Tax=Limosa lapponica baueri TaxID=1758121 RepID=A0A2I0T304_LIMLA|nr:cytochrome p450 2k1-like [Limosa lapponica baueri]